MLTVTAIASIERRRGTAEVLARCLYKRRTKLLMETVAVLIDFLCRPRSGSLGIHFQSLGQNDGKMTCKKEFLNISLVACVLFTSQR